MAASDNAFANHFENTVVELWVLAKRFELEGVVGKDDRAMYVAGRSDRWLRSKRKQAASARGAAPAAITMKMLTRQGHLVEEEGMSYIADIDADNPLASLQAASCTYRIALWPRAGQKGSSSEGAQKTNEIMATPNSAGKTASIVLAGASARNRNCVQG